MLTEKVTKWKMRDAYKEFNESCKTMSEKKRECNKVLKEETANVKFRKCFMMIQDVSKRKASSTKIRIKKIDFLTEKRRKNDLNEYKMKKRREEENCIIEGVRISDRPLTDDFDNKPQCYGGITLNENEQKTLSLPPKFAMYEEIRAEKCEAEIEKGMAKLRWNRRKEEDGEQTRQHAFDIDTKTMNYRHLRPTEMKYNKRVYLPKQMSEEEEVKALNLKNMLMQEIEEYSKNNKNKMRMSNLKRKERDGLKSLKKRCKNGLVVSQTDKSGKFSADSKDNYIKSMEEHVLKDEDITEEVHTKAQKEANAHSIFWSRMLCISSETGKGEAQRHINQQRAKNNLLVEGSELPPVYGLRKDHKKTNDMNKGPPLRPVCSATTAYNSKLAHLVNTYLARIWKNESENCASTEELLAEFQQINEKGIDQDCFVGSADVVALYPSLDIDSVVKVIGEMIIKSEIKLEGINYEEVGLYLSIHRKQDELKELGLQRICPKRKRKQGRPPTLTGQAAANPSDRKETWQPGEAPKTEEERRKMVSEAFKIILKFLLQNHMYTFNDEKKRQRNGGPIGLVLTDAVAKVYMTWWDRKVKEKAMKEGMEIILYRRYVDDINVIARINKDYENENEREQEGMEMFKRIGDSIDNSIKLEIDYPSRHEDGKMPLLDVKVWMEEIDSKKESSQEQKIKKKAIRYEHYRKSMASRMTVHARSAIPENQKRNIITQEVIRILKNCSRELPWEIKVKHLEQLSLRLQYSGYDMKFRREVIDSGVKAYRKMIENDKQNVIPLYRTREWKRNNRENEKNKERRMVQERRL